jgi:hypothetical protein
MRVHVLVRKQPLAVLEVATDLSRVRAVMRRDQFNWPKAEYEVSERELDLRGEDTRRRRGGVTRRVLQAICDCPGIGLGRIREEVWGRNEDIAESLRFLVRHGYAEKSERRRYHPTAEGETYLRRIASVPLPPKKGALLEQVQRTLSNRVLSAREIAAEVLGSRSRRDRSRASSLAHHLALQGRAVAAGGKFLGERKETQR